MRTTDDERDGPNRPATKPTEPRRNVGLNVQSPLHWTRFSTGTRRKKDRHSDQDTNSNSNNNKHETPIFQKFLLMSAFPSSQISEHETMRQNKTTTQKKEKTQGLFLYL